MLDVNPAVDVQPQIADAQLNPAVDVPQPRAVDVPQPRAAADAVSVCWIELNLVLLAASALAA